MYNLLISFVRLTVIFAFLTQPVISAEKKWRSPESVEGTVTISVAEAKKLFDDGATFIDVRNPRLFAKGHIPGAHHLDLKTAFDEAAVSALADKDDPVVIYCSGIKCGRSYRASAKAVSWGYTRVKYFRTGIVEWKKAGYLISSTPEADQIESEKRK
jgi:rhodanese-related sulfurtransferase